MNWFLKSLFKCFPSLYFLTNFRPFPWLALCHIRIFIFHISLYSITRVSVQPSFLHYKYREKSEDRKHISLNSTIYRLDTLYLDSGWGSTLFRCRRNLCQGVPASLLTHAWLLWKSLSPHSDPACRRGTSHPRRTSWRWCWWLPSWWVWT